MGSAFDRDGNGVVDRNEFCSVIESAAAQGASITPVGALLGADVALQYIGRRYRNNGWGGLSSSDAFAVFDKADDGILTFDEWLRMLRVIKAGLGEIDASAVFYQFAGRPSTGMTQLQFHTFVEAALRV